MKEQTVGIASLGRVLNIGDRRIQQLVVDLGDIMPLPDRNFSNGGRWPLSLSGVDYLQRFLPGDVGSDSASRGREAGSQLSLVPYT